MLNQIAEIAGFPLARTDAIVVTILERIKAKMPKNIEVGSLDFADAVKKAEAEVDAEGEMAISAMVKAIVAPPAPKEYKIRPTLKGKRIAVPAANGVRFSYGPIWTEACLSVSGIAINDYNRPKLNHRALMAGIENPEAMDVVELCTAVAAVIKAEMESENE